MSLAPRPDPTDKSRESSSLPESLLKKRRTVAAADTLAAAAKIEASKARRKSRRTEFKHPAAFVRQFKQLENQEMQLKRVAKGRGGIKKNDGSGGRLLAVVRMGGIHEMHPNSKKMLQLLRLRNLNNMVFVKESKATMNMVQKVEPYIAYGYPTLKTVRDVIYKRGHGKVDRQRVPLTDNSVIEAQLGQHGIICMEDLVHEIYSVGPHFKEAATFLWPVKLGTFKDKATMTNKEKTGKLVRASKDEVGNKEQKINDIIAAMN